LRRPARIFQATPSALPSGVTLPTRSTQTEARPTSSSMIHFPLDLEVDIHDPASLTGQVEEIFAAFDSQIWLSILLASPSTSRITKGVKIA
jgi:hypothetical protein